MGQFDFAQARTLFADLAAAHPDRADTAGRPRGRDAEPAAGGGRSGRAADPAARALGGSGEPPRPLQPRARPAERRTRRRCAAALRARRRTRSERGYAHYYVGQPKVQTGDTAGALTAYERALALSPRLRSAAYGSFQPLQRLGRTDAAARMLERFRALETDPRSDASSSVHAHGGRWRTPVPPPASPGIASRRRTRRASPPPTSTVTARSICSSPPRSTATGRREMPCS